MTSTEIPPQERERLMILLRTKKWNPYCIRHSSLTEKADYLPEYALRKMARWSMNSRQVARYVKPKMGVELKNKILLHDGIINDVQAKPKPSILNCPKCQFVNHYDTLYCKQCSYPLTSEAYEKIKQEEGKKFREMEERFTRMEEQLKRISQSNANFHMPFENSCREVTVVPVQRYIFPDNISEDELRIQVSEILQGKRKPNGAPEYKIVSKEAKEQMQDPKSQMLLLTNF